MLPAGEMWSVVTESPSRASTLAPEMSVTGCGSAGIPSKYGGLGTDRAIVFHSEGVAAWRRQVAPPLVALEHVGVVLHEHLGVDRRGNRCGDVLLRRPDVLQI